MATNRTKAVDYRGTTIDTFLPLSIRKTMTSYVLNYMNKSTQKNEIVYQDEFITKLLLTRYKKLKDMNVSNDVLMAECRTKIGEIMRKDRYNKEYVGAAVYQKVSINNDIELENGKVIKQKPIIIYGTRKVLKNNGYLDEYRDRHVIKKRKSTTKQEIQADKNEDPENYVAKQLKDDAQGY